jgi:hypothetical protein
MPHTTSRHPDSSVRMDGTGESENVSDITVDAPRVRRSYNRLVNNPVLEDYSLRYAPKSSVPGRPMRWHRPRSAASPISPIRPSAARSPCSSALRTRGVPGEADQQHAQLNGVLSGLGMTADTEVTILSDGADGPRSLGEAASTGTVFHGLDWFHLAMRVQHAARCASGWPNATVRDRRDGARFAERPSQTWGENQTRRWRWASCCGQGPGPAGCSTPMFGTVSR